VLQRVGGIGNFNAPAGCWRDPDVVYPTFKPPVSVLVIINVCRSGFGLSMIVFAFLTTLPVGFRPTVSCVFDNVSVVIRSSILQIFTPTR
jgi:hypothetical protein